MPQLLVLVLFASAIAWLVGNTLDNLASRGIMVGFSFLGRAARFPISESLLPYDPTDSFFWALVSGLSNTLLISLTVSVLATVLALPVALARRSSHPLAYGLASTFVDAIRNTPLVVQLLFWYGVVTFGLPPSASAARPFPGVFLTDRGLYLPRFAIEGTAWPFLLILTGGALCAGAAAVHARRRRVATGHSRHFARYVIAAAVAAATLAWVISDLELTSSRPQLGRFNFAGGMTLSPEFAAVTLGLVLYATAFIAEIFRGGIDAVPKGQWEAGRAVGLRERDTLRLIVVPQAMRVIIPPLTSQYINIIKNSTLALVVGYPELNFVIATTINQTGQALEGILILMTIFLMISLAASLLMNWYNQRLAIVER